MGALTSLKKGLNPKSETVNVRAWAGANSMGAMTREDLALFKENIAQVSQRFSSASLPLYLSTS